MRRSEQQSVAFTPAEAAYLATACLSAEGEEGEDPQVKVRTIHKAIEENVFTAAQSAGRIALDEPALLYILSHQRLQRLTLSHQAKLRLYQALSTLDDSPEPGWSVELDDGVHYTLGAAVRRWRSMVRTYAAHRDAHVTADPSIMGGSPVIRGTRLPVHSVLARIDHGDTIDDLLDDYPDVPREAFEVAVTYARTHPRRGRPKRLR